MFLITILGVLLICIAQGVVGDDILVEVEQGTLSGEYLKTIIDSKNYYSFKGIPYAKPPVGSLRFRDPQPAESWEGVRDAKQHGSVCPQINLANNVYNPGSEDCLFLNVYSSNVTADPPLPVVVFIHGGDYKYGSGDVRLYGPDFFMLQDVILVTMNYRLDALGFLSLGTKEVPGNAGLKDQNLALKWVQKNIAKFGGDPDNVTLMGHSAGSSAVTFHVLSPMSKGLFQRTICLSGVAYNDFTIAHFPVRRAFALARSLGFDTKNTDELLSFLQNVTRDKLINSTAPILQFEEMSSFSSKIIPFVPVIEVDVGQENIFLSQDPAEALSSGNINEVDFLIGYTYQEGTQSIPLLEIFLPSYYSYPEMFVPGKIVYESNSHKILQLSSKIVDYYFGNKIVSKVNMPELVSYSSNSSFVYDIHRFARKVSTSQNVYFYKFGAITDRNFFSQQGIAYNLTGPTHGDDVFYYFDPKVLNMTLKPNTAEYKMVKICSSLVANFANFGNPTPDSSSGFTWPTYNSETLTYLDLTNSPSIQTGADELDVQFWKGILEEADIEW